MAINDIYTTYKCKICKSEVREIPLNDNWGEHVMSKFECTNKDCNMRVSECDYDINVYDFIEETFHRKDN